MFGWEFPPHIAGGLGTACYGMTRGLARNGVDVTFIVPHAYGDEDQRFTHVVNASDVEALYGSTGSGADDILEKMSFIHIDSNMVPYISPEEYEVYHEKYVKSGERTWSTTDAWKQRYTFSGKYGANLMEEATKKTEGVQDAVVNFMTQKMIVEFSEGSDPKAVMKAVLKNCKKVEDDCEIYL